MSISKIRLPNNTEEDIKAKYLIQSSSSDATSAEFSARTVNEDAIANIQKIYGETLKIKQQIVNGDFSNGTNDWSLTPGTISVSGNEATVTITSTSGSSCLRQSVSVYSGHKYYISYIINTSTAGYAGYFYSPTQWFDKITSDDLNKDFRFRTIIEANSNKTNLYIGVYGVPVNSSYKISNIWMMDLTNLFGAGNEPTIEEFEALYTEAYYPYDSGSLLSNNVTAILSRGTNQWDEQWRNGYYGETTGVYADAAYVCTKNPIPITGGNQYYLRMGESARIYISYYNSQGSLINTTTWKVVYSGNTFTPPPDATSMNFWVVGTYGGSYKNDICINISNPAKNGTYEPYNGHQIDLNIPTLTGKLNGAGSSVVIFPDGMGYDGENRDELTMSTALKKTGCVDLGDLTWSALANNPGKFYAQVSGVKASTKNIICAKYSNASAWNSISDKQGAITSPSFGATDRYFIYDTDFSSYSAAQVKTALSGVSLVYELATPEEYILDNSLQLQYPVVAGGTEMVLPTTGTAPMKMDVIYGNAADATSNLSSNFISVDSMKAFLNNLGTQMGGTWNMQYNNGKFEFTFSSS